MLQLNVAVTILTYLLLALGWTREFCCSLYHQIIDVYRQNPKILLTVRLSYYSVSISASPRAVLLCLYFPWWKKKVSNGELG